MGDKSSPKSVETAAGIARWIVAVTIAAAGAGLVARLLLPAAAVRYAYPYDHFDNVAMGVAAGEHGLLEVYSVPVRENRPIVGQIYSRSEGRMTPRRHVSQRVANYPPLGVSLFYLQAELLDDVAPGASINTYTSRLVMSSVSILADIVLVLAVYLLAAMLCGRPAGLLAAAVCWCFPPLVLDTSFWGQTDSWFLAPAVVSLYLMLRRRWYAAGACIAVAAMLKPQALFLGPIALVAAVMVATKTALSPSLATVARRIGIVLAVAVVGAGLLASPWIVADGLEWFDRSYVANFTMYQDTTLKAFNVWYLDLLARERSTDALDSLRPLAGLSRQGWGQIAVLATMGGLGVGCAWRYRRRRALGVVVFAGLWLWSTFIWPTGVHERYIVYCMPPLIVAAGAMRRLWPAVLILAALGVAEMTHKNWLDVPAATYARQADVWTRRYEQLPPDRRPPGEQFRRDLDRLGERVAENRRSYRWMEYVMTLLSLGIYAAAVAACFARPPAGGRPKAEAPLAADRGDRRGASRRRRKSPRRGGSS